MALKNLNEQINKTDRAMRNMMKTCSYVDIFEVWKAYQDLRQTIEKFTSFVEHRWMVKLFTTDGSSVEIKIEAEHLEEARDISIELVDTFFEVIRFELYCDGILIPEHE